MSGETTPIRADELDQLFAPLPGPPEADVALAVSGGSDSMAMMVLFADWLLRQGRDSAQHTVLTVDHHLRSGSGAEARRVGERAAALGFRHVVLDWQDPKPSTGLQAAAREARYRLMRDYLSAHGMTTLLVAHTRDDQAETLLMRLARGSGLDGMAAMAPAREIDVRHDGPPLRVVRPLLGLCKARLRATLDERGIAWIEDPSNVEPAFERTRWRALHSERHALGLSSEMLALSARRLQRARAALEAITDAQCTAPGVVHTDPCGAFEIDRQRLRQAPEEIALRLLGRCIAAAGGLPEPVPLAGLEPVVAHVWGGGPPEVDGSWTLARAQIKARGRAVVIEREPGRIPPPVATVGAGAKLLWDGRFSVQIGKAFDGRLEVRALARAGLAELKRRGRITKMSPVLLLAPAFWRGDELLAVPSVAFWAQQDLERMISARFKGLRYNFGPRASGEHAGPCQSGQ
ncbi:MAG: tRNA lysidine(34) synthetase TilS [Hyphomicrobiaceae bacterium]|nr:tRNA lysidine(34) synthetase TilS [Hyphomicrobiaceae bacterium]